MSTSRQSPLHAGAAAAGAHFRERGGWLLPAHFGDAAGEYRQTAASAVFFDRSAVGKIEVHGADAGSFLHNLCTNDIKGLAEGWGCEALFVTMKARLVAYTYIDHLACQDGGFWIETAPGMSEKLIRHLDHFLVSEQVEFSDRTHEYAQVHLAGPRAGEILVALP